MRPVSGEPMRWSAPLGPGTTSNAALHNLMVAVGDTADMREAQGGLKVAAYEPKSARCSAVLGLNTIAARLRPSAISESSSSHLPPIEAEVGELCDAPTRAVEPPQRSVDHFRQTEKSAREPKNVLARHVRRC